MVSYKDKIVIIPLFNTCYPENLARNLARTWQEKGPSVKKMPGGHF